MKKAKQLISVILVMVLVISSPISTAAIKAADQKTVTGTVAEIQKYGNLTIDIKPSKLYEAGYELGDILKVTVGEKTLSIPFCTSYSDVDTGSLVVRDSKEEDLLIVAINMGNFATTYGANKGDTVTFSLGEKQGYLSEYLLRQLTRTNNREDYATDSIFANFRSITTTGIKPGVLYRSSNPSNNELGRAAYADRLTEAVGVKTVLNLADSDSIIKEHMSASDYKSEYYKNLFEKGQVAALNMTVDISGKDFQEKLVKGLRFMANHEAPYLVHCTEGKDRAGYVSAVLECLMGATYDEVIKDYMLTYENYYHVVRGSEQYNSIAKSNIITSLTTVMCGYEKDKDISKENLSKAAENYLKRIGLTEEEIKSLKAELSVDSVYKTPKMSGKVVEIEKYGHTSTDIKIKDFYNAGFKAGDMVTAIFDNGFVLEAPFLDGYYVDNGKPLVRAYKGHTNIALCINYGKLFEVADVKVGDKVTIMLTKKEGYLTEYEIRKLERTNNRKDYSSDKVFANFRNMTMGNLEKGVLYRSSSPINNELGRAAYADKLEKKAKVKTIVNLADSDANIKNYEKAADFKSPYYKSLYKKGQVLPLNMGLSYKSDDFKDSVIEGLKFMSKNPAPYLFHCTEGKDRTGFYGALLGAFMKGTKEEIVADYMQSYVNYYHVKKGTKQYKLISEDVLAMLKYIAKTDNLDKVDLSKAAVNYMREGKMTTAEIKALRKNLSTSVKK